MSFCHLVYGSHAAFNVGTVRDLCNPTISLYQERLAIAHKTYVAHAQTQSQWNHSPPRTKVKQHSLSFRLHMAANFSICNGHHTFHLNIHCNTAKRKHLMVKWGQDQSVVAMHCSFTGK